jgi:hypothetical protein
VKGYLVRIGVDHSYGQWNAPVDPSSSAFVYIPIPDNAQKRYAPDLERKYQEFVKPLAEFAQRFSHARKAKVTLPSVLLQTKLHLDPDFEYLTYGDNGTKRGAGLAKLERNDLVAFYAGLRPITNQEGLFYALIGILVVDRVVQAQEVEAARRKENAHTRWSCISEKDIVIRGLCQSSGRFDHCITIGEFRDRAYRVRKDLEKTWGGLSVKNGYIQRSAVPPAFLDAQKFYDWFREQNVKLLRRNN